MSKSLLKEKENEVRFANLKDLPYIVNLSKRENSSLGFIPKVAYEAAITGIKKGKRWSDVCNDRLFVILANGDLVGFCLASFGNPFTKTRRGKIAQICLQEDARKVSRGKMLLDCVRAYGATIGCCNFKCGCADDLESNFFWLSVGWNKIYQRQGISHKNTWLETSDRKINIYIKNDERILTLF